MTTYRCTDGLGPAKEIEAENPTEAARLYVGPAKEWRKNGYDDDTVDIDVTEICHDPADEFTSHIKITLDDVYLIIDQDSGQATTRASDADEAIDWYADSIDFGADNDNIRSFWVSITAHDRDGIRTSRKVQIDPTEPPCEDGNEHNWTSPHEIVGGLKENPGVWGHGGGVVITEVCSHCGLRRITDTWAQDPTDGEQGLTSVEYGRDYEEEK